MNKNEQLEDLSYQIIGLLERTLIEIVLQRDSFMITEKQLKIMYSNEAVYSRFLKLIDSVKKMGFIIERGIVSINITLPNITNDDSFKIINESFPILENKNLLSELINNEDFSDILIKDMKIHPQNWALDNELNIENTLRDVKIYIRYSSTTACIKCPQAGGAVEVFDLSFEETCKLFSFVKNAFPLDVQRNQIYLNRANQLRKNLE